MSRRRLNRRQQLRIDRRLQQHWEGSTDQLESGMVCARFGRHAEVIADGTGRNGSLHCDLRANLKDVVCGDQVLFEPIDENRGIIVSRKERRSALARPEAGGRLRCVAANLDRLFVVTAPEPAPDLLLLDQYLVAGEHAGIRPVIVRNKCDLTDPDLDAALQYYAAIGYMVLAISSHQRQGIDLLRGEAVDRLCACVGQSGVGKSSLIHALLPEFDIAVGELSAGGGTHTTTTARAYPLPDGGYLVDAPGIREFPLQPMTRLALEHAFPEFRAFEGGCRFRDCQHLAEPDCAIRSAVEAGEILSSRLQSFHRFMAAAEPGAGQVPA